jgi:hypothetical protein
LRIADLLWIELLIRICDCGLIADLRIQQSADLRIQQSTLTNQSAILNRPINNKSAIRNPQSAITSPRSPPGYRHSSTDSIRRGGRARSSLRAAAG